jgi:hypothetical protein
LKLVILKIDVKLEANHTAIAAVNVSARLNMYVFGRNKHADDRVIHVLTSPLLSPALPHPDFVLRLVWPRRSSALKEASKHAFYGTFRDMKRKRGGGVSQHFSSV